MNEQVLLTHLPAVWESLPRTNFYKFLEMLLRIFSAVINNRGGFLDEKKV